MEEVKENQMIATVNISKTVLTRCFNHAEILPKETVIQRLEKRIGSLCFISAFVDYGVAITIGPDGKYIASVNVGKYSFKDDFYALSEVFVAYGLDYTLMRFVSKNDLIAEAIKEEITTQKADDAVE